MKMTTNFRVQLIQAAGGEENHHALNQAQLSAMQHVVQWNVGDNGKSAIAYLEELKTDAKEGTPAYNVSHEMQKVMMKVSAMLSGFLGGTVSPVDIPQSERVEATETV